MIKSVTKNSLLECTVMTIGENIATARVKAGFTQEGLAAYAGVSRQAVQKWESGACLPETQKLILLCRRFDISMDEMVGNEAFGRTAEERRNERRHLPNYVRLNGWDLYSADFRVEYQQLLDEGRNVEKYKNLVSEINALPPTREREVATEAVAALMFAEPVRDGYAFYEPSGLDEIRSSRKPSGVRLPEVCDKSALQSKIRGAWLGRIAGCLLGKPYEGIRTKELNLVLKATGNFPLSRYTLQSELTEELYEQVQFQLRDHCWADTVECAPADDDTNYTVMAATQILEKYGRDFSPCDVLHTWVECQPKAAYCTAERVAYINFINGYEPPGSAVHKNPYREWIGAQIRADYYGYINPADPEAAADMAWRDASISHVKNGIYGEMFVAAMLAAAAVCDDVKTVILCGLAEIPQQSRLYAEIMEIMNLYDTGKTAGDCASLIHERYDENTMHGWCHTLSNAMIVVMSLLYGGKDYGKSICMAVGCGFDTDCNGATVGSIVGMMIGEAGIPPEWTKPFGETLQTRIFGTEYITVDKLCELTMKHMPKK